MYMAEPRLVIANREDLWWLLMEASQLEHMIMCQYLFAEFSLKDGTDEGLTAPQAEAVERWRKLIRGIAVEEMLHMALVANVMASIGAAPYFGRPNFPQQSGYFPSGIQLDLVRFGERSLLHFLYLERPEGMERQDAEGFVPSAPPLEPLSEEELMPRGQEFMTVGHLYRGIEDGLRALCSRFGERAVFVGSPRAQATPELLQWPQVVAVTDLDSALAAIGEIIEQGEGARGDWRNAHYGRFLSMWEEFHALREQDPSFDPARPSIATYTHQPFDIEDPMPVIGDPLTLRVAELGTVGYELVLHLLTRFFTHTDETDEQLGMLIGTAIELMADVVRPIGTMLSRLPAGPQHGDATAGLTFQMHYAMGNFVPWREPAWALLHERMSLLHERCGSLREHDGAPDVVHSAGERVGELTSKIAAHVPDELRPGR
jgi:Ferritin-like